MYRYVQKMRRPQIRASFSTTASSIQDLRPATCCASASRKMLDKILDTSWCYVYLPQSTSWRYCCCTCIRTCVMMCQKMIVIFLFSRNGNLVLENGLGRKSVQRHSTTNALTAQEANSADVLLGNRSRLMHTWHLTPDERWINSRGGEIQDTLDSQPSQLHVNPTDSTNCGRITNAHQ